jgi:hypothetical protein
MTALEESTARLIAAARADDLLGVEEALTARASAIAELAADSPSVAAALEAGQIACHALEALKLRIRSESGHLARIEALVHNLLVRPDPCIELRG